MPTELNSDNFESETSGETWVVDFWAEWCGPCKQLAPIFEEVSEEVDSVKFGKVDMESESDIGSKFGVRALPTMVIMEDGEEIARKSGVPSKQQLIDWVEQEV